MYTAMNHSHWAPPPAEDLTSLEFVHYDQKP